MNFMEMRYTNALLLLLLSIQVHQFNPLFVFSELGQKTGSKTSYKPL